MKKAVFLIFLLLTGCGIDYSCETDEDCAIMNVGNQCGFYPQCVNIDFEPEPPELDSSVCGFPDIIGCECVRNRCVGIT